MRKALTILLTLLLVLFENLWFSRSSLSIHFTASETVWVTSSIPGQRGIPPIARGRRLKVSNRFTMPNEDKEVTLGRILMHQTAILGRGTCIVEATCKEVGNMELVLEIGFPSTSRKSEVDVLDAIVGAASEDAEWVHLHPPRMSFFMDSGWTFVYEKPITQLILSGKLTPVDHLREPRDYAQFFFDILQTHRRLYEVPKILHGDLSRSNIMAQRDSKGRYRGVLNDWDLSSHLKDIGQGATSYFRTGTRPFMAHELHLMGPDGTHMHQYRHDLESLFFIMVLFFCRNSSEGLLRPYHVEGFKVWDSRNDEQLYCTKKLFLMDKCKHFPLPGFDSFRRWIQDLHRIFFYGLLMKNMRIMMGEDDDPKLMLNIVTYDSFFAVMAPFKHTPKSEPLIVSYPPS